MAVTPHIGVFGGAFDPPHAAHLALAEAALDQLGLAELRIFPTGQAWHKSRDLTGPLHRVAMARLAFEGLSGVVVDDRETRRSGPTYTVDTLRELKSEYSGSALVLIMGADQARALPQWREWEAVLSLATIAIADRPLPQDPDHVTFHETYPWAKRPDARTLHIVLPEMNLSATDIRSRMASADPSATPLVPEAVARYIEQHHLYRTA